MTSAPARPRLSPPASLAPSEELLVALDIDGTIVQIDGYLHPVVAKGVAAMRRRGAAVVLATGRGVDGVLPIARQLGMSDGYAVCANGAVVLQFDDSPAGYHLSDVVTFDPASVLDQLRERIPSALFLVEDGNGDHYTTGPFPDGELATAPPIVPFERLRHMAATRVTVRAPDVPSAEFAELIADTGLHGVGYYIGWSAWLDIAPQGVSKASALEMLRGRLQIAPHATVAVGDGSNDVEMLAWAHYSVAMGQAPPQVQAQANEVTAPVTGGGLAYVLSAILTR